MTYIYPGCHYDVSREDNDVDFETEFYNIPDQRIMDLLKQASFEAE
jgi:hypothetical protein